MARPQTGSAIPFIDERGGSGVQGRNYGCGPGRDGGGDGSGMERAGDVTLVAAPIPAAETPSEWSERWLTYRRERGYHAQIPADRRGAVRGVRRGFPSAAGRSTRSARGGFRSAIDPRNL